MMLEIAWKQGNSAEYTQKGRYCSLTSVKATHRVRKGFYDNG